MSRKIVCGFANKDMRQWYLERGFDKIKTCFALGEKRRAMPGIGQAIQFERKWL